jgi:hypothetical protein
MHWQDVLDALQLQEHLVPDNDIDAVAAIQQNAIVIQRRIDLARVGDRVAFELKADSVYRGLTLGAEVPWRRERNRSDTKFHRVRTMLHEARTK